jgi:hypothetical protein
MKTNYPRCFNFWFKDYPKTIRVVCGPAISNLNGSWSENSVIVLTQTSESMKRSFAYVPGGSLPDYRLVYTDTGQESSWDIRFEIYGYGTLVYGSGGFWDGEDYILPKDYYDICYIRHFEVYSANKDIGFHSTGVFTTKIPKNLRMRGFTGVFIASPPPADNPFPYTPPKPGPNPDSDMPDWNYNDYIYRSAAFILLGFYSIATPPFTLSSPHSLTVTASVVSPTGFPHSFIDSQNQECKWSSVFETKGLLVGTLPIPTHPAFYLLVMKYNGSKYSCLQAWIITEIKYNSVSRILQLWKTCKDINCDSFTIGWF